MPAVPGSKCGRGRPRSQVLRLVSGTLPWHRREAFVETAQGRAVTEKKPDPWTTLQSRVVYDNPWITLIENDVLNVAGTPKLYTKIHMKRKATGVVALDERGWTYLVGQQRYPLDLYSWEVPEGGSEEGEDPLDTIKRELKEEAGLTAREWQHVLTMHLSNMLTDEVAYGYIATGLTVGAAEPEESEVLELKHLPFLEAFAMAMDGAISDAISVALLLKVRLLAERGELPGDLNRLVKF